MAQAGGLECEPAPFPSKAVCFPAGSPLRRKGRPLQTTGFAQRSSASPPLWLWGSLVGGP
eukprot:10522956-Lingulodinium_polyedra.AAC.1